jgi:hypothetical protein
MSFLSQVFSNSHVSFFSMSRQKQGSKLHLFRNFNFIKWGRRTVLLYSALCVKMSKSSSTPILLKKDLEKFQKSLAILSLFYIFFSLRVYSHTCHHPYRYMLIKLFNHPWIFEIYCYKRPPFLYSSSIIIDVKHSKLVPHEISRLTLKRFGWNEYWSENEFIFRQNDVHFRLTFGSISRNFNSGNPNLWYIIEHGGLSNCVDLLCLYLLYYP